MGPPESWDNPKPTKGVPCSIAPSAGGTVGRSRDGWRCWSTRPLTASGQQRRGLAWIARRSVPGEAACARLGADVVDMMSGPSDRFVDLALLTLACSVGEITWLVGKFYDFDHT